MSNKRRKEMFKESKSVKQRYATRKLKVGMVSLLMGFTFIFASAPAAKVIGIPMTVSAEEVDLSSAKEAAKQSIEDALNKKNKAIDDGDASKTAKEAAKKAAGEIAEAEKVKVDEAETAELAKTAGESGVTKVGEVEVPTALSEAQTAAEAAINTAAEEKIAEIKGVQGASEEDITAAEEKVNAAQSTAIEAIKKAENPQGVTEAQTAGEEAINKVANPQTAPVEGNTSGGSSSSGGGGGGGSYTPASKVTSDRIAGSNRFDTAVKVSQSAYPDGAKTVILANGEKFSDVLAAMPYGKTIKAPILYTNFDNIPDETLKELKRLGVEKVILVGGEKSISLDEQKTLEGKGYKIDRINGVDRYETSKLIAERMKAAGAKGINDVIIASGQVFPDALSISPLAVENEIPILLTSKDTLSEYTIKSLDNVKDGKIYITGGVNSVSNSVESKLKEYTKQKITRFAGADRYETSQIIAKSLRPNATTSVFASGELFSDALVAGELVSKDNAPLMLVKKNNLPSSISNYVKDSKITNNVIVGGVNTVSDSVVSKLEELENR